MNTEDLAIHPALASILKGIDGVARQGATGGVSVAVQAHVSGLMRIAAHSVATIAGLPPCQLQYPHAEVKIGYDSQGNLRYECLHTPMHCWDLNGHKGTC